MDNDSKEIKEINKSELTLLQIGYDFKYIMELLKKINNDSITIIGMIPFVSLFCYEAIEVFDKYNIGFKVPQNHSFSLHDIRLKTKLFENEYSRSKNIILNCDYLQDYIFKHKLKFKFLHKFNIHYNLGIFLDDDGNIVGNSQYGYYIFQDNKMLKKKIAETEKIMYTGKLHYEIEPEDCREYGRFCGTIIAYINNIFDELNFNVKLNESDVRFFYKDINTNKDLNLISGKNDEKALTLYLLHLLSTINFVLKILRKYENTDNGWWLKVYYITYYYSVQRLLNIKNYMNINKITNDKIQKFYSVINIDAKELINVNFRNCMMHYELIDSNKNFLIKEEYLDIKEPLFGLVESCFDGTKYNELKNKIIDKLDKLSKEIQILLNIDLSNPKRF